MTTLCYNNLIILLLSYLPALYFLTKYFQGRGILWFVVFIISILLGLKFYKNKPVLFLKISKILLVLVLIFLIFVLFIVYPSINRYQQVFKMGSDRDEALILAVTNLLHGENPYKDRTYLGNPISPLPGSVILAIPFVLFRAIMFQNIIWLGILIFIIYRLTKNKSNIILFTLFLFLNPLIWWEIITASDYLTNSIFYFVFVVLLLFERPSNELLENILLTAFGALVLCSRFIFWLPLPLIILYLWNKKNYSHLKILIASFLLNLLVIVLSFYLVGPANFSPLHTANFLFFSIKSFNLLNVIIFLVVIIMFLFIFQKKIITLAKQLSGCLSDRLELIKIMGLIFLLCSLASVVTRGDLYFLIYSTPAIIFLIFYLIQKYVMDENMEKIDFGV